MRIIISPAKQMQVNTDAFACSTLPVFMEKTEILVCGDTRQLKDYSKTDWPWTLFDPAAKQKRHEEVFPLKCQNAYEMGAALALK